MNDARAVVLATVSVVLVVTLLTGPAVGLLTVSSPGTFGGSDLGTGNATISHVTFPDDPTLQAGRYGTEGYVLRTGDVRVDIAHVTGRPMLIYKLEVEGISYTRSSLIVLEPGTTGTRSVQLSRDTLAASAVERDSYPGQLRLVLRGDGPDRVVAAENVTVTVQG